MKLQEPDDAIRLAKQLGFVLKILAGEFDLELSDLSVKISADDQALLTINAGELVQAAEGLTYGSLGEGADL